MPETFDWFKPSLVWQVDGQDFRQPDFFRPQLLEFHSDNFMEDFFAAAGAAKPDALQNHILAAPAGSDTNRKLFQPVHGRYYLTCTSLCCRLPGFPDREVRLADGENVFFVLRKLVGSNEAGWTEHGWVADEQKKGWYSLGNQPRRVLNAKEKDPGNEERLPLFTTTAGNDRPILFGYVPVASQETYLAAATDSPVSVPENDPRPDEYHETVTRSLETLLKAAAMSKTEARQVSLFLLLDLSIFLSTNAPDVYAVLGGQTPSTALNSAQQALVAYLRARKNGPD